MPDTVRALVAASLVLCAVTLAPLRAEDSEEESSEEAYAEFGVWRTSRTLEDTGEDYRLTCAATTGGDGDPVIVVSISDGDAFPPHGWPSVVLYESAPRGHQTALRSGDAVGFAFDGGAATPGLTSDAYDPDGILWAIAMPDGDRMQETLRLMRERSAMVVVGPRGAAASASLTGFTAAYGWMAQECGFSTRGVID